MPTRLVEYGPEYPHNYYDYEFISPEPIFEKVKAELTSYFEADLVNDALFPIWTDRAIKKFRRSAYKILPIVLFIDQFEAKLPPDFIAPREVWACSTSISTERRIPGSYYTEVASALRKPQDPCLDCDPSLPSDAILTYKVNTYESLNIKKTFMLRPGTIHTERLCDGVKTNFHNASATDVFDIRDGKINVNFHTGEVYMLYYSKITDDNGFQMIPDNERIISYLEAVLYYQVFQILWNTVTDETFNQIERKFKYYEQKMDEARANAEVELKKDTPQSAYRRSQRVQERFRKLDM